MPLSILEEKASQSALIKFHISLGKDLTSGL